MVNWPVNWPVELCHYVGEALWWHPSTSVAERLRKPRYAQQSTRLEKCSEAFLVLWPVFTQSSSPVTNDQSTLGFKLLSTGIFFIANIHTSAASKMQFCQLVTLFVTFPVWSYVRLQGPWPASFQRSSAVASKRWAELCRDLSLFS